MQLPLGPDPRSEILCKIQGLLIEHFGRVIRPTEKRRDPVWVLVQGVIGARTKTAVSNANTDALLKRYESWEAVATAPLEELTEMLRTATFPSVAAERLKACLTEIITQRGSATLVHLHNMLTGEAMAWLETLPGVARKISAGIMNTSTFNRPALVIDTNHRRVVQRMGLVPAKADTERCFDILTPLMPPEWSAQDIDEHHLLVKRIGQTLCRPKETKCNQCLLRTECKTGSAYLE